MKLSYGDRCQSELAQLLISTSAEATKGRYHPIIRQRCLATASRAQIRKIDPMRKPLSALLCLGALLTTLGFSGVARADCFDDAYAQYTGFDMTSYSIAGKRSSDLQILYSFGDFAAESGTVFRSGVRGGSSWTPYDMVGAPTFTAAPMYVKLNFTARTLQLSVPSWGYYQTISATCSGGVIQASDGLNTWLLTLKGHNAPH